MSKRMEALRDARLVSDDGKRWRIEHPDWVMQPVGRVSCGQAKAICDATLSTDAGEAVAAAAHEMIDYLYDNGKGWIGTENVTGRLVVLAGKMRDALAAAPPASTDARMREIATEFCRRVEAGEIRSKRTYAAFKEALASATREASAPVSDAVREALHFKQEHVAFEELAKRYGFDVQQHPLHYIFMDPKTSSVRDGWRWAIGYVETVLNKALSTPASVQGNSSDGEQEPDALLSPADADLNRDQPGGSARLDRLAPSDPAPQGQDAEIWSEFVQLCEHYESEAEQKIASGFTGDKAEHEHGYWRGQKITAKNIRRAVVHPKYRTRAPEATEARPSIGYLANEIIAKSELMMTGKASYLQYIAKCAETILDRLAAAPPAAKPVSVETIAREWQPIDSAPKDGTEIWAFNGEQARMKWISGEGYALWIYADDLLTDADPVAEQPTHYMPLPAAPSDLAREEGGK